MGTVHAERWIEAPVDAVWAVLSDLERWSEWNDRMVDAHCEGGVGARLTARVRVVGPLWFPVRSRAVEWADNEAIAWGRSNSRWVSAHHGLRLHAHGNRTRVEHYEHFGGPIGQLVTVAVGWSLTRNYGRFLDALAARVEAGP